MGILGSALIWLMVGTISLAFLHNSSSTNLLWWMSFLGCGMSFVGANLMSFYIAFELSLIPILLMILIWGSQPERLSAGLYFLIYTAFFSVPFLMGIVIFSYPCWVMGSTYEFGLLLTGVTLAPFLVKLPLYGMHFWLPKAHVEASTSGSMLLASLLLKLGGYGVMRLMMIIKMPMWGGLTFLLVSLSSAVTALQSDSKKLIAYSSVTHMTMMVILPFLGGSMTMGMVILLSLAHSWASSGMFLMGGALSHSSHSRLLYLMSMVSKFSKFILISGVLLLVNSSIPPFPSFFSEIIIVSYMVACNSLLTLLFVVISFFVCCYNVKVFLYCSLVKPGIWKSSVLTKSLSDTPVILVILSLISLLWLV
uniref:NADH-ubiquinone oxidoreductase chain 4 n=1 Tax=Paralongidorus litoralis TaxID=474435 RepID=A0A1P8C766_9BILA|nr:NADH dehydrogenase subunit 4 [Paralongidorus litoralis]AOT84247.1 NADH dehydrogenase subunit 4 [Paralongidorus litoralis]